MQLINVNDQYGLLRTPHGLKTAYQGEVEFIIRDRHGNVLHQVREKNIIKISAKEILAHALPHNKVWDPSGGTGEGAWVTHDIDLDEFTPKYIVFGASFDSDGNPLDASDDRYYVLDSISNSYIPRTLNVGVDYDGGLINAIPIAEPTRPLKRIERIFFEPSYQPAGTPLLQSDVRAINNVVVFETTLLKEEYNGLGLTSGDFFTITEVALVGAREMDSVGSCECDPRSIFLTGDNDVAFLASASGTATISLDPSVSDVDAIKEGDQIKIVEVGGTADGTDTLDQVNPYYLVSSKALGGRDITLDRTPVDSDNAPIVGEIGVLRDGFRIFSHRILKSPVKKMGDVEIVVRWRIIFG